MKLYNFVLLVFLFGANALSEGPESCVLAQTESGLVCGARKKDFNGGPFASFLGVPYARAPMGELRFAEPQKPDPFSGVFNATVQGPICPQNTTKAVGIFMTPTSISEDCLHVNIHVPLTSLPDLSPEGPKLDKPLLPILVFIHGGSYTTGAGDPDTHGPEYLIPKDIMVVTLNHRLGVLGFLTLKSGQIPYNIGLRDVTFALQWIQRNIRNFGGDPDRVTLGGISSGAGIAHILSTLPSTKGQNLFKRLILMSATVIATSMISQKQAEFKTRLFLRGMGLNHIKDPVKIHQKLMKAPLSKILEAQQFVRKKTKFPRLFGPVVDSFSDGQTPLIPKEPALLLEEGYGNEYPTLFGITDAECRLPVNFSSEFLTKATKFPSLLIPSYAKPVNVLKVPILYRMISKRYLNGTDATNQLLDYCEDAAFRYPVLRAIDKRLEAGVRNTFFYEFAYFWEGVNYYRKVMNMNVTRAVHSADIAFVFRMNAADPDLKINENLKNNDNKIREFMTDAFANFVKFGHPGEKLADWTPASNMYEHMSVVAPQPVFHPASPDMLEMKKFFDKMTRIGRGQFLPPGLKSPKQHLMGAKG